MDIYQAIAKTIGADMLKKLDDYLNPMKRLLSSPDFLAGLQHLASGGPIPDLIVKIADEALNENARLNTASKAELRSARDDFARKKALIFEIAASLEGSRKQDFLTSYHDALIIGRMGDPDFIDGLFSEARKAQTEPGRQAKQRKAERRQEALQWAILEAANGEQLKKSDKFAYRLLPAVLKHLPEDYDQSKVTPTAIKKEIIAMCSVAVEKAIFESAFADDLPRK